MSGGWRSPTPRYVDPYRRFRTNVFGSGLGSAALSDVHEDAALDSASSGDALSVGGLAPTASLGTPVLAPGAVGLAPGGLAPTVGLGTPSVVAGAVAVSVLGVAPSVALGTPAVSGAGSDQFSVGGDGTAALFPIDGVFEPPDVRRRTG